MATPVRDSHLNELRENMQIRMHFVFFLSLSFCLISYSLFQFCENNTILAQKIRDTCCGELLEADDIYLLSWSTWSSSLRGVSCDSVGLLIGHNTFALQFAYGNNIVPLIYTNYSDCARFSNWCNIAIFWSAIQSNHILLRSRCTCAMINEIKRQCRALCCCEWRREFAKSTHSSCFCRRHCWFGCEFGVDPTAKRETLWFV